MTVEGCGTSSLQVCPSSLLSPLVGMLTCGLYIFLSIGIKCMGVMH